MVFAQNLVLKNTVVNKNPQWKQENKHSETRCAPTETLSQFFLLLHTDRAFARSDRYYSSSCINAVACSSKARQSALAIQCSGKMRQLGLVNALYTDDYKYWVYPRDNMGSDLLAQNLSHSLDGSMFISSADMLMLNWVVVHICR